MGEFMKEHPDRGVGRLTDGVRRIVIAEETQAQIH